MTEKAIVQVALAATDLEAIIYQRKLREKGIQSIILDQDDNPYLPDRNIGKKVENLKVLTLGGDAEAAREIIKDIESKKDTRVISKSGEYVIFRCPHCAKYIYFLARDKGSKQFCPHCSKILEVSA